MPAPVLPWTPNGPGWPAARQMPQPGYAQVPGYAQPPQNGMGDWVDLNQVTQPPPGPWSQPLPEARYGPWKSAPLAPQPPQILGTEMSQSPFATTSPWAVPAPDVPFNGVGDWMELSGMGQYGLGDKKWLYVAGALALGFGLCWVIKRK